jgi:hypothetical protein
VQLVHDCGGADEHLCGTDGQVEGIPWLEAAQSFEGGCGRDIRLWILSFVAVQASIVRGLWQDYGIRIRGGPGFAAGHPIALVYWGDGGLGMKS